MIFIKGWKNQKINTLLYVALTIKQSIQLVEIKKLLIDTSYKVSENKLLWYDVNMCDNVADIDKASERLYNAK